VPDENASRSHIRYEVLDKSRLNQAEESNHQKSLLAKVFHAIHHPSIRSDPD